MYKLAERDVFRWRRQVFWHSSYEKFKGISLFKTGVHSFQESGLFYDFLVENNNSNTTAFFFHAAIDRQGKKLPFFTGNNVLSGGTVNRVFISDPSLLMSPTVRIAWFAGVSRGVRIQECMLSAISHLNASLGSEKTLFMGPSNGGVAALYYSWFFPNSIAYVMNPQTRIQDFTRSAVENFAIKCLGARDKAETDMVLHMKTTSDVRTLYAEKFDNHVVYVQNVTDHHVKQQMEPFLKVAKKRVHLIMGNFGDGHKAPPVEHTATILSRIALIKPYDISDDSIQSVLFSN